MTVNKRKTKERRLKKGIKKQEKEAFLKTVLAGRIPPFVEAGNDLLPTTSGLRLSKVARGLKKGISEIANYLNDNGFEVNSTPNAKLSIDQIEFLNGSRKENAIEDYRVIDYTYRLLEDLKLDYNLIFKLSPVQFENLVAEFLTKSGFNVRLNGQTNRKDGGIDLIAWKKDIVTIVIAIQVKFKNDKYKKVSSSEVRDFKGAMAINDFFSAGMVVTNTDFTVDARWIEEQIHSKLELKNYDDLKQWLNSNFSSKKEITLDLNLGKDIYFREQI